jgi:hypothetical protein
MFQKWISLGLMSISLVLIMGAVPVLGVQEGLRDEQPPVSVEEIITQFAAKETEFGIARGRYTYRQDVTVQELDASDRIRGEYRMVSDILFEEGGLRRTEKIVYAPPNTLDRIQLTPQDLEDLESIQPFVLTTEQLRLYDVEYLGKEKIDEIDCYVFEVGPTEIEEDMRYFEGRIWVDDLDLQIVKTYGKAVPDLFDDGQENLFPRFETYREQIDGVYWFPTYTRSDDTLNFSSGPVRIRQIIRYQDYQQFGADVTFTFGDEVEGEEEEEEEDEEEPAQEPQN